MDEKESSMSLGVPWTPVPSESSTTVRSNAVRRDVGFQPTRVELGPASVRIARVLHGPSMKSYTITPGSPGPGEAVRLVGGPALYGEQALLIDVVNDTTDAVETCGVVFGRGVPVVGGG